MIATRRLVRGSFSIWEALDQLSTVQAPGCRHDAVPNLAQQALQTAEMCRLAYPQQDWLHLVALIHELGKLLAHPRSALFLLAFTLYVLTSTAKTVHHSRGFCPVASTNTLPVELYLFVSQIV